MGTSAYFRAFVSATRSSQPPLADEQCVLVDARSLFEDRTPDGLSALGPSAADSATPCHGEPWSEGAPVIEPAKPVEPTTELAELESATRDRLTPDQKAVVLGFVVFVIAVMLAAVTPGFFAFRMPEEWLYVVALFVGFWGSTRLGVKLVSVTQSYSYSLNEVVLVLGLLFVDPIWALAARLIAHLCECVAFSKSPPLKCLFNASLASYEVALAYAILHTLSGGSVTPSLWLWAVVHVAVFASMLTSALFVKSVMSFYERNLLVSVRLETTSVLMTSLPSSTVAAAIGMATLVEPWLGLAVSSVAPIVWRVVAFHAKIEFDASHDRLTGLSNRNFFENWVNDACSVPDSSGAVFLMDLDRFKEVNDAFGHDAGDRLLQACSRRLTNAVPPGATVGRFGGDEFVIHVPNMGADEAVALAQKLTEVIDEPFALSEASVAVTSSIGIAIAPGNGNNSSILLRRADIAMYESKRNYSRVTLYDPSLDESNAARLSLIADLRQALSDDQLDVHYQPKVNVSSGVVESAEALARWHHPELGPIRPDMFVELAEQAGMIEPLTDAVMGKATTSAAAWQRRGWHIGVAVNISAQSLLDERLVDMVAKHLTQTGLDPRLLTLEITESTMMVDPGRTDHMLSRLTDVGVQISIDDFGTGYSSLSSLGQLPVSELKIDRSFVTDMESNQSSAVIVRSTIELAHNLDLRIVAEGVETQSILAELSGLRCDLAQGYGISPPLPYDQIAAWIAARTRSSETSWRWGDLTDASGVSGVSVPDAPPLSKELVETELEMAVERVRQMETEGDPADPPRAAF